MNPITIDKEFQSLIPPLSDEEFRGLKEAIAKDGIREPLVTWNGILLDGHNRIIIAKELKIEFKTVAYEFGSRDEAKIWILKNQFARRNIAPFTRVELALKLEPLLAAKAKEKVFAAGERGGEGGRGKKKTLVNNCSQGFSKDENKTRHKLAEIAGVAHGTVTRGKLVARHADEATKAKLRNNKISVHAVAKEIKEKLGREERKAERVAAAKDSAMDKRVLIGDFREHAASIPNGSLSLIFTDPPYDRDASKMLPALAEFAKAKLAKGGSLICYVGQTQLPAAMDAFREHLRYWWTIACVHGGRSTVMREYGVNAGWKAVLWFVKGTRDDNSIFVSDVMSGGQEKTHHDWQQSQSEAEYWIEKLCPKDGIVCDPFLGGGTTAAACEAKKRKWIGIEIDPANAAIASERVGK